MRQYAQDVHESNVVRLTPRPRVDSSEIQSDQSGTKKVLNLPQPKIIVKNSKMQDVVNRLRRAAQFEYLPVLITGESGVGKQEAAHFLHETSRAIHGQEKHHPFIELNCAGLPETLLESELFGHEQGAFTDAKRRKIGLLQLANGGTLFLDEIGAAGLKLQTHILKFLETGKFRRIGGTNDIVIETRVVAATNCDLEREIKNGRFRDDLFQRLNVYRIEIPPLVERVDEIGSLVGDCIERFNKKYGTRVSTRISALPLSVLIQRQWRGNVRELFNVIERAIVNHGTEGSLNLSDFGDNDNRDSGGSENAQRLEVVDQQGKVSAPRILKIGDDLTLEDLTRLHLEALLRRYNYKVTKVSRILGIRPKGVYSRLSRAGTSIERLRLGDDITPGEN